MAYKSTLDTEDLKHKVPAVSVQAQVININTPHIILVMSLSSTKNKHLVMTFLILGEQYCLLIKDQKKNFHILLEPRYIL